MATDYFVKIDGIDGESNDKAHQKWIEVERFEHGSMQNITTGRTTDVAGRGQFLPFVFVHKLDKATPKLQRYCMSGQKFAKVVFHVCRAIGDAQVTVYEVTLEKAKITRATVFTGASAAEAPADQVLAETVYLPYERVELVAAKMTWKVTPIKSDNTKDGAVEANFDQESNS